MNYNQGSSGLFCGCIPLDDSQVEIIEAHYSSKNQLVQTCMKNSANFSRLKYLLLEIRNWCYFTFQMKTGFRVSECLSLKIKDVWDIDKGCCKDFVCVEKCNMKGKKKRRIMKLANSAKERITDLLAYWESMYGEPIDANSYLFRAYNRRNSDGRMNPSTIFRILKKLFSELGFSTEHLSSHML